MTASHRSNRRRSRSAIRRALLGCETLESRQLLAIDTLPPLFAGSSEFSADEPPAATLHYFAGSEKIEMQVHPRRIALSLATQPLATQPPGGWRCPS